MSNTTHTAYPIPTPDLAEDTGIPEDTRVTDDQGITGSYRTDEPTTGELQLYERASLQRVAGLSTELTDITEVEYRQLRLERVVLVGVWTEGTSAQARAAMTELAALAETAG